MLSLVLVRLVVAVALVWALGTLTFALVYLAPGDPGTLLAARSIGRLPQPHEIEAIKAANGLDKSPWDQYRFWLGGAVQGNFGVSLLSGRPVAFEIGSRLGWTAQLAASAFVVATTAGITIGALAGARPGRTADRLAQLGALLGVSMPNFWVGYLLIIVFAGVLGWIPTHGAEDWRNLLMPTATLALVPTARLSRLVRAVVVDALARPHVITAHAKGLARAPILWRHALRLAAAPILTRIGIEFGGLVTGAVVVEVVFAWPGVGSYFLQAAQSRDIPAIQALVLVFGLVLILANLAADLAALGVDPRLRLSTVRW